MEFQNFKSWNLRDSLSLNLSKICINRALLRLQIFGDCLPPCPPDFNFSASKLKEHKETVIAKAGAKAPRFCWLWLCQRVSCSWQMSDNWYQSAFSRPTVVTKKVLIYQRFKFQHDRRLTQTVRCLTVIAKCLTKIDRCLTYTF